MLQPETKIVPVPSVPGRILVTSDIHGHLSHLKSLLKKADFCENDLLIIAGDMLDKGAESLNTLRYVMALCEKGNVLPLIGNADAAQLTILNLLSGENAPSVYEDILAMRDWYGTCFFEELAAECGCVLNSPEDVLAARDKILRCCRAEIEFLAKLPTVAEAENFVFVHGGLREKAVADNAAKTVRELTKYDAFMENTPHIFDKYLIVGHWPVNLYNHSIQQLNPVVNREKHIISIDGGCGTKRREEQLNMLVLPDGGCDVEDIVFLREEKFPVIRALENQSPSEDSLHINWTTRDVNILQPGEEFTYVKHIASGRKLTVPTSRIYGENKCNDYTDYLLPVKAGDALSLLEVTSAGVIAKQNGIVGWYLGKYEEG